MTDTFFTELCTELTHGATQKEHPFRYFTLATVGLDKVARLRTVVLRAVDENLTMTFYTDRRSKKLVHLNENNRLSGLFYHPKKLMQLRIEGTAQLENDPKKIQTLWEGIAPHAQKDYTAEQTPGSSLEDPDRLDYLKDKNHFCVIHFKPAKIEYLKLKSPHHIRVQFSKSAAGWESEFLVP